MRSSRRFPPDALSQSGSPRAVATGPNTDSNEFFEIGVLNEKSERVLHRGVVQSEGFLDQRMSSATREAVAEAPPGLRAALIVGSPDFMRR
jgi:hypothetical protein